MLDQTHLISEACLFSDVSLSLKQTIKIPMPADRGGKALLKAVSETSPCRTSKVKVGPASHCTERPVEGSLTSHFYLSIYLLPFYIEGGEASQAVWRSGYSLEPRLTNKQGDTDPKTGF